MGVCQSKDAQKQAISNRKIENDIKQQKATQRKIIKLLLLGPGECGKSTILKQMRIIHEKDFSDSEMTNHRLSIHTNIIESMQAILNFMKREEIKLDDKKLAPSAMFLHSLDDQKEKGLEDNAEIYKILKKLWADGGLRRACERKTEILLSDGVYYVFDVGGQLSERKKWIHVFDDVNAIIFIVALNDYDKVLREDSKMNSMDDAMSLFADTINNGYFLNTLIILFLNKTDLFAKKILSVPLNTAYPNYDGPQTYTDCLKYIRGQLLLLNQNEERQIRTHETCATDSNQVQVVIKSTTEKIMEKVFQSSGVI